LIIDYLKQWNKGLRKDFIELLKDKLPDVLTDMQKENRVRNYLTALKCDGIIQYNGDNKRSGVWVLTKNTENNLF
jgi:ATP-dependent DNA helicase RecG